MSALILEVNTFANGFGEWRARVGFSHTLSESDTRPAFNLHTHWARIRRVAREHIIREIADIHAGALHYCPHSHKRRSVALKCAESMRIELSA